MPPAEQPRRAGLASLTSPFPGALLPVRAASASGGHIPHREFPARPSHGKDTHDGEARFVILSVVVRLIPYRTINDKKPPTGGGSERKCHALVESGVSVFHFADAVLILTQFLRGHHSALVVKHHAAYFVSDMLCRLQHQLKVLQFIAVGRHLHEDRHTRGGK